MMMMMGSMSGTMRHAGALAANVAGGGPVQPPPPHYGASSPHENPSVMHALEEARAAAAAAMTAADQARHQVARERRERQAVEDELTDVRDALAEEQRRRERAEHAAAVSFDDAEYARELLHEHAVASASAKVQSVRPNVGEGPNVGGGSDASARRDPPPGVASAAQATLHAAAEAASLLEELKGGLRATLEQQRHLQQAQREAVAAVPQAPPRVAPPRPASPVERFQSKPAVSVPPSRGPGRVPRPSSSTAAASPGAYYHRDFGVVPSASKPTPGLRRAKDHVTLRDDGVGTHGASFSVAPEHVTHNALEAARREYAADKRMALERRRQRMMMDEYGQLAH